MNADSNKSYGAIKGSEAYLDTSNSETTEELVGSQINFSQGEKIQALTKKKLLEQAYQLYDSLELPGKYR